MKSGDWRKISQVYHEALAHDASERARFLDEACAGDARLRQELDSLLQPPPGADTAFESATAEMGAFLSAEVALTSDWKDAPGSHEHGDPGFAGAIAAFLSKSSSLAALGSDTVGSLLAAMQPREFGVGEYLIRQGDPADYLLLILSGTAWARVRDTPIDRPPVGEFGPGDIVGEMSLITDEPRTADVLSRTPVRSLLLPAPDFHRLADRHPDLRVVLTNLVADRLGHARYDGLGGKDIHGYRIVACIGHGGMGIVYEARQLATGDTVALKMMNHRLVYQAGALQRFRREAAILKTLNHASIARLYDRFSAYKTEFLAMEFCLGSTLDDVISTHGPLDEVVVRNIVGQLAVALMYIHDRGIIHRDLKPSNVMVSPSGLIKLLDFGLGKLDAAAADWSAASGSASGPAVLLGTPRYMAPELFSGQAADRRTDFYGLACVAYEALSGRPVIQASDVFAIVREQFRFALPPREQIGRGVSKSMYELLTRGLDSSPEKRTLDLAQLGTWSGPIDFGIG